MASARDPLAGFALGARRRRAHRDLVAALPRVGVDADALDDVMAPLRRLFHADASCAYRGSPAGEGWALDHYYADGARTGPMRTDLAALLARTPHKWAWFDPLHPEPEQRNVVVDVRRRVPDAVFAAGATVTEVLRPNDLHEHQQLRVLVCDGPVLLSWFGVFRRAPFSAADAALLQTLVGPLAERLRLQHATAEAAIFRAGLVAALEQLGAPAFLCRADARIELANTTGRALFDDAPAETRRRLRDALAAPSPAVTPIALPGFGAWALVVLPTAAPDRLAAAVRRWSLTPRQRDVLALLVAGDTNKAIALKLRCAEVTVEFHVTALLRRAEVENRAALIASFFRD